MNSKVERHFLIVLGTKGTICSGKKTARMIYAYRKAMPIDP
ncbi:MAG: hypothetical protein OEY25_14960 [Candidatus Aminicenantes bacterium]|nr:hypothetical protein [Candidatus Aminicenantes bacterium]